MSSQERSLRVEAVVLHHTIPKETRSHQFGSIARVSVKVGGSKELRHLGIAVLAGQDVGVGLQSIVFVCKQ